MDHIRSLLPKVLSKRGLQGHALAALLCWKANDWYQEKLPLLAPLVRAQRYANGELLVAVEHSIAAQECQGVSPQLLCYLQEEFPQAGVERIRIVRERQKNQRNTQK